MTSANRGQGGAIEHIGQDHPNQENNMLSRLRQVKNNIENQENVNPKQSKRTVLGVLQNNPRNRSQLQRGAKQGASSQELSCKNDDSGKGLAEKAGCKQPAFQIHVDEPDGACAKKHVPKPKSPVESPLKLNPSVVRLRQPLAPIDISMDVGFDSPMDMSVVQAEEEPTNTNEVSDYAAEIHKHLREMELKCRPKASYMKKQPDITNSMRAILVDWLVEVGEEYKLQNETLYLAVNYIDRFLSSMSVLRGKLQLVGTAAMLLASKFEEIYAPEVAEFVYITDDTYTKKQVLRMEHLVLKVLSFDLAAPTINQFLTQYFLHQPVDDKVESLSMFLGELSLIDSDPFLKYLPSMTAAAAFVLAHYTISRGSWSLSLEEVTEYSLDDLMPCINDLHETYLNAARHAQQSVREKYKGSKFLETSTSYPLATTWGLNVCIYLGLFALLLLLLVLLLWLLIRQLRNSVGNSALQPGRSVREPLAQIREHVL